MSTRNKAFAYAPKQYLSDVVLRIQEPTFHRWMNKTVYITESVRALLYTTPKRPAFLHCDNFRDLMFALWAGLFRSSTTGNTFSITVPLRQKGVRRPREIRFTVLIGYRYGSTDEHNTLTIMLPNEYLVW